MEVFRGNGLSELHGYLRVLLGTAAGDGMGPRSGKVRTAGDLPWATGATSLCAGQQALETLDSQEILGHCIRRGVDGSSFAGHPRGHCCQASAMPGGQQSWLHGEYSAGVRMEGMRRAHTCDSGRLQSDTSHSNEAAQNSPGPPLLHGVSLNGLGPGSRSVWFRP